MEPALHTEIFFSILARRLLRHGAFSDPDDLATQMLAFVEHYNLTAQTIRLDPHRQAARRMRTTTNRSDH